jgi:probable F420-dependent oxidoreductase
MPYDQLAGIRFGVVNETAAAGRAFVDHVRRIEDAGIDVFLVRDHLMAAAYGPQFAPFPVLATAAAVTERLRVGTMVLCNDFRHPALVAHEAASLHQLSGGRFELGLGAGWFPPEFEAAGIGFDAPPRRIDRLEESLAIVRGLFSGRPVDHDGSAYRIKGLDLGIVPVEFGYPPIVVGAGGPRMLRVAARAADVVGILPAPIRGGEDSDDPLDRSPEAFDRKLAVIREAAAGRPAPPEISTFVTVRIADNRREATEQLIRERGWAGVDAEAVWAMPTIFVGSVGQIRDDLRARRERFGLAYLVCSDTDVPTLARVLG